MGLPLAAFLLFVTILFWAYLIARHLFYFLFVATPLGWPLLALLLVLVGINQVYPFMDSEPDTRFDIGEVRILPMQAAGFRGGFADFITVAYVNHTDHEIAVPIVLCTDAAGRPFFTGIAESVIFKYFDMRPDSHPAIVDANFLKMGWPATIGYYVNTSVMLRNDISLDCKPYADADAMIRDNPALHFDPWGRIVAAGEFVAAGSSKLPTLRQMNLLH